MRENDVWDIVDRPSTDQQGNNINLLDSRWIFKRKEDSEGKTIYRARLVFRGFRDKNEYELIETYAPVSRLSIVRNVLAIVNKLDLEIGQMDVKTAFLNSDLEEEIYLVIPEGLECDQSFKKNKVCRLKKSIYGLKISS